MTVRGKLLQAFGFLLLALGVIGIFFPILPTTPFVLGAAGCFSRNAKLSHWLMGIPIFKEYICSYKERTGLSKSTVLTSLIFLWIMLSVSAVLLHTVWGAVLLPAIGVAVTVHILYIAVPKNKEKR